MNPLPRGSSKQGSSYYQSDQCCIQCQRGHLGSRKIRRFQDSWCAHRRYAPSESPARPCSRATWCRRWRQSRGPELGLSWWGWRLAHYWRRLRWWWDSWWEVKQPWEWNGIQIKTASFAKKKKRGWWIGGFVEKGGDGGVGGVKGWTLELTNNDVGSNCDFKVSKFWL